MDKVQLTFSGGGGFLPYYLGIAKFIQEKYVIDNNILLSGASCGIIPIILLRLNINIDEFYKNKAKNFINKYKAFNFFKLNLYKDGKDFLNEIINNKNNYLKFNNSTYISVTEINKLKFKNKLISNWESHDDFINICIASAHLPILGKSITYNYKNKVYIDGGITDNRPVPFKIYPSIVIHYTKWRKFSRIFLIPFANIKNCDYLFNLGYSDAEKNRNDFDKILTTKSNE